MLIDTADTHQAEEQILYKEWEEKMLAEREYDRYVLSTLAARVLDEILNGAKVRWVE